MFSLDVNVAIAEGGARSPAVARNYFAFGSNLLRRQVRVSQNSLVLGHLGVVPHPAAHS